MFISGWARNAMPRELSGVQFNSKRKVGMGRGTSLSFLSSPLASIISSSIRLGKGVFLSLHGQARFTNYFCSCVHRTCPRDH